MLLRIFLQKSIIRKWIIYVTLIPEPDHGPTIHQSTYEEIPLEFSTIRMKKTKTEIEKGDVDSVQ